MVEYYCMIVWAGGGVYFNPRKGGYTKAKPSIWSKAVRGNGRRSKLSDKHAHGTITRLQPLFENKYGGKDESPYRFIRNKHAMAASGKINHMSVSLINTNYNNVLVMATVRQEKTDFGRAA